jgi:hypothetical protein
MAVARDDHSIVVVFDSIDNFAQVVSDGSQWLRAHGHNLWRTATILSTAYARLELKNAIIEPYRCRCDYQTIRSGAEALAHGLVRGPECTHAEHSHPVG